MSFIRWLFPLAPKMDPKNIDSIVDKILVEDSSIRHKVETTPGLRKQLEYSVMDSYAENHNLRRMAGYVDTADKALVPIDAIADYMKIMGGVGYGISAAKEMGEAIFKLPYMAYYAAKSHDILGTIGNLAYEGLSWFVPTSILDLTNRYANQADKYIAKTAKKNFLANLEGAVSAVPDNVVDFKPKDIAQDYKKAA